MRSPPGAAHRGGRPHAAGVRTGAAGAHRGARPGAETDPPTPSAGTAGQGDHGTLRQARETRETEAARDAGGQEPRKSVNPRVGHPGSRASRKPGSQGPGATGDAGPGSPERISSRRPEARGTATGPQWAALNASYTFLGMRPRAGTSILWALAQARTAAGSGATCVWRYALPERARLRPAST